jgi:hypothetical protein
MTLVAEPRVDMASRVIGIEDPVMPYRVHRNGSDGAPSLVVKCSIGDLWYRAETLTIQGRPRSLSLTPGLVARVHLAIEDSGIEPGVKVYASLVVGDTDLISDIGTSRLRSKHLKAEALAAKGQPIRFLVESDFMALSRSFAGYGRTLICIPHYSNRRLARSA